MSAVRWRRRGPPTRTRGASWEHAGSQRGAPGQSGGDQRGMSGESPASQWGTSGGPTGTGENQRTNQRRASGEPVEKQRRSNGEPAGNQRGTGDRDCGGTEAETRTQRGCLVSACVIGTDLALLAHVDEELLPPWPFRYFHAFAWVQITRVALRVLMTAGAQKT